MDMEEISSKWECWFSLKQENNIFAAATALLNALVLVLWTFYFYFYFYTFYSTS